MDNLTHSEIKRKIADIRELLTYIQTYTPTEKSLMLMVESLLSTLETVSELSRRT